MNGPEYLLDSASAGAQGEPGAFMLTDELLARVALLAPQIAQAAGAIDAERRFPPELIDAFHNAQLFRILIPRRYGGLQAHPLAFMRTLEELAKLDASAAWIVGQNSVCAIVSAYLAPEVARPVFGDPRSVLAWGPQTGPARIQACDGGYRVTGKWSFASGMRQATWLGCQATVHESDGSPRLDAQGRHVKRVMLIPASVAKVEDIWDVIGLRGTASDAYSVENLFVADGYTVNRESPAENREPGWIYAFSIHTLFSCGFACVALGVARAMLDAFMDLAGHKTPRGAPSILRDSAVTRSDVAQAHARIEAARAYLMQSVQDICAQVEHTREVSLDQRMRIRLASTHAIREARNAGAFAYEAAGASAIFANNPFERRFRDLHAIAQQLQARKSHFETVGGYLLGAEVDTQFA